MAIAAALVIVALIAVAPAAQAQYFIDECCQATDLRTPDPSCCVLSQLTPVLSPSQKLVYINTLCSETCSRNYTSCLSQTVSQVETINVRQNNVSKINMYAGYLMMNESLGDNYCGTTGPLSGIDCFTAGGYFSSQAEMELCVNAAFFNNTCPDDPCFNALFQVPTSCRSVLFSSPALGDQMLQVYRACGITQPATINATTGKAASAVLMAAFTSTLALIILAAMSM